MGLAAIQVATNPVYPFGLEDRPITSPRKGRWIRTWIG